MRRHRSLQQNYMAKSGYKLVGGHSAVKLCHYTRLGLTIGRSCYKRWYGIESHRCVQMTPAVQLCNFRCLFCWRHHEEGRSLTRLEWDPPEAILKGCLEAQRKLISGYAANPLVSKQRLEEAKMPKHIAISLDGEPTLYPYLPKLIELASEQGMTTFLVTNGTIPAAIEALTTEPTNLYISLYGPDRETYEAVAGAGAGNLWENVLRSLRLLAKFRCRTVIRLTLTKGLNMLKPDLYGELISTSEAKYIEVKGYAWLGQSRRRLPKAAAPSFEEVKEFAVKLSDTTRYRLRGEDRPGRVILLSR